MAPSDFLSLRVVDDPAPEDRDAVLQALRAYNEAVAGPARMQPLAVLLQDAKGGSVGGLWGRSSYDWLFVEYLAIPDHVRGQGYGSQLMRLAEDAARDRDCAGVWLDTFAFQARGFYERLGYSVFGTIDDHPRGSCRYFMSKRLPA